MFLKTLFICLCFAILTTADVSISKPLSGQTYTVEDGVVTVPVAWIESNTEPKITSLKSYSFKICTGSNTNINGIKTLDKVSSSDITGDSYDLKIPSTIGADGSYFIQIYSALDDSGFTIHYSPRFILNGMTGTLIPTGNDISPPNAEIHLDGEAATAKTDDTSKSFTIPYTSQTGKTRYAPMQTQPASKVTASTWSRKFETSAVTFYSIVKTSMDHVSTVTPGWSYTISSAANWASAAPNPSDNGGWYDPASRLNIATLTKLTDGAISTGSKTLSNNKSSS